MNFRMIRDSIFVSIVAVLSATLLFAAQEQTKSAQAEKEEISPLTYAVEVELVQIAVRITDKEGKWISGIKETDLELYEDGVPQEIRYIDEILPAPSEQPQTTRTTPALERKEFVIASTLPNSILIIFDATNSGKNGLEKHKQHIKDFLHSYNIPETIFCVILVKPTGDYEMLQNFTSEKSALLEAIDKIQGATAGYEDRLFKTSQISDSTALEQCASRRGQSKFDCAETAFRRVIDKAAGYAAEDQVRASNAVQSLKHLFEITEHVPGKKSVILVSEGMDPAGSFYYNFGANVIEYFMQRFGLPPSFRTYVTEMKAEASGSFDKLREVRELIKSANASDIAVYWANPEYGKTIQDISSETDNPTSFNMNLVNVPDMLSTMRGLAEDTGGAALSSYDPGKFYKQIVESVPRYYLLSYKPPRAVNDGKFHRIEVKAKTKNYVVSYRKDFKDFELKERISNELAGAHDFPGIATRFPMTSEVNYFRKSDGEFHVMIRTGISYEDIEPRVIEGNAVDDIHFSFIVRDRKGDTIFDTHPILKVRTRYSDFQALKETKTVLEYTQSYNMKSGSYRLSLAAMDVSGWKTAADLETFTLPGPVEHCLSISPPMLADRVAKSNTVSTTPIPTEKGEMLYGENVFSFHVKRVFPQKGALSGFYQIYNAREGLDVAPSVFISFKLYRDENFFINQTPEREIKAFTDPLQKLISNFFSVPYNNLAPGYYQLVINIREGSSDCRASTRVPFEIR